MPVIGHRSKRVISSHPHQSAKIVSYPIPSDKATSNDLCIQTLNQNRAVPMAVVSTQAQQADAVRQALQISSERASHSQRAEELLRDDEQVPDLLDRGHAPKLQDGGVAEAGVQEAGLADDRAQAVSGGFERRLSRRRGRAGGGSAGVDGVRVYGVCGPAQPAGLNPLCRVPPIWHSAKGFLIFFTAFLPSATWSGTRQRRFCLKKLFAECPRSDTRQRVF